MPARKPNATLTLAVITEAHLSLSETNGVLSSGYTVELLELGLVDALYTIVSIPLQAVSPLRLAPNSLGWGNTAQWP